MKIIAAMSSLVVMVVMMLAACGGGGAEPPSALDSLLAQAAAKQKEARSLAVDTPCSQNSQCSVLVFASTNPGCNVDLPEKDYKIYSLVSSTATQASATTDQYNLLASQARNMQKPASGLGICIDLATDPPTPVCVANKCQATR